MIDKIKKARAEKERVLDLSGLDFSRTGPPNELWDLEQLESLNLSTGGLTVVPEAIGRLKNLTSLNVSGNRLTTLPRSIGSLSSLVSLDAQSNEIETIPETIGSLAKLSMLELSHNRLVSLPAEMSQLAKLEYLQLSRNSFCQLPSWIGDLRSLRVLNLFSNVLTELPKSIGELVSLQNLACGNNKMTELPPSLANCREIVFIDLGDPAGGLPLTSFPEALRSLPKLTDIYAQSCGLTSLPDWIGELSSLKSLRLQRNRIRDLPQSIGLLPQLEVVELDDNPLNPELLAAFDEGRQALLSYLRARTHGQTSLNEAKLILVGEGEVGKSCLLAALRDDPWIAGNETTHGIEIKQVRIAGPGRPSEVVLNGWDFGGQRVYRPTHQLFFSTPAIYLVVWKPREGTQQGLVREWLTLIRHREPEAKVFVVATHGGAKNRQPDIDRQEIWDEFGRDMVVDFFTVDNKPRGEKAVRTGISALKVAIGNVARSLPEMGRRVPSQWDRTRVALTSSAEPYLPLRDVLSAARSCGLSENEANEFVRVSHRLGHFMHYAHDSILRDVVILKPDWLATAISFVLDDAEIRQLCGVATFKKLRQLWDDPRRGSQRYSKDLHPIFLRLMERFDLSYRVAGAKDSDDSPTSLIAQLVPDVRPSAIPRWPDDPRPGDCQQSQICRIVDGTTGQTAVAEGLFYQLIVRLHKYSLGRFDHALSSHWQRGLVLEDDYGATALLEHVGKDVRISVRSPYPERFLAALTYEVKWLVESFWAGLRCDIMVPCLNEVPCSGMFEVRNLLENKQRGRPEQPCPVCNEWQSIDMLLNNAPADRPSPLPELLENSIEAVTLLNAIRRQLAAQQSEVRDRFTQLDASSRELVSKVEAGFTGLMRAFVDEAKDGPRLFSVEPVSPKLFSKPGWLVQKFRVTLWCEHSRLPLSILNGGDDRRGVYELEIPRAWLAKAAPYLKVLSGALSLIVPVAASASKVVMEEALYKGIEAQLSLGEACASSFLEGGNAIGSWLASGDSFAIPPDHLVVAKGADLRQLHSWLVEKDPGFGGLVRVQNRRREFLWVHERFESEY